jgi:hypothetical protein
MLRRLGLGVLALIALGLVTSRPAAAQDQGMGMDMSGSSGSGAPMSGMSMGTSDCGCSGMSMPGMGMSMPGMGMWGSSMGLPGMGMMGMGMMGMPGMGMMGMGMTGMGSSSGGTYQGPGAGWIPVFTTAIHHPGDQIIPGTMCTGCSALYDSCVWGGQCSYMEAGLWPDNLGLHSTMNRPDLARYWPQGPLSCVRGRANNPATCVDAPGEWNLRAGMPGMDTGTGGMAR